MAKRSDYTPAQWAQLYPEQRYAIEHADIDAAMGRNAIPVRAADGRSVVYVDKTTGQAAPMAPSRRIGGL